MYHADEPPFLQPWPVTYVEDFLNDDFHGNTTWTANGVGTGAVVSAVLSSVFLVGACGVVGLLTGTTPTGSASLRQGTQAFPLGFGALDIELRARHTTSLPDGTDNWTCRLGLGDNALSSAIPTMGLSFVFDHVQSPNWICEAIFPGLGTVKVITDEPAIGGWRRFRIQVSEVGDSAKFFIENRFVGAINLSTVALNEQTLRYGPYIQINKTLGIVSKSFVLDAVRLTKDTYR